MKQMIVALFGLGIAWTASAADFHEVMGDAVHANARGCQIIGRLLKIWFKE